jgi:hypothetical protein
MMRGFLDLQISRRQLTGVANPTDDVRRFVTHQINIPSERQSNEGPLLN